MSPPSTVQRSIWYRVSKSSETEKVYSSLLYLSRNGKEIGLMLLRKNRIFQKHESSEMKLIERDRCLKRLQNLIGTPDIRNPDCGYRTMVKKE
mgnify:CR=1 FL=1